MPYIAMVSAYDLAFFWQIGIIKLRGVSIRRLKPIQGIVSETNTLPIGLNRICWKQEEDKPLTDDGAEALPIGLNRICWKPSSLPAQAPKETPNPTDWVKSDLLETSLQSEWSRGFHPLPIGLNRICWKPGTLHCAVYLIWLYRLG